MRMREIVSLLGCGGENKEVGREVMALKDPMGGSTLVFPDTTLDEIFVRATRE